MRKLMSKISLVNEMKHIYTYCDFIWERNSYTFNLAREQEKTHLEKNSLKILRKNNV